MFRSTNCDVACSAGSITTAVLTDRKFIRVRHVTKEKAWMVNWVRDIGYFGCMVKLAEKPFHYGLRKGKAKFRRFSTTQIILLSRLLDILDKLTRPTKFKSSYSDHLQINHFCTIKQNSYRKPKSYILNIKLKSIIGMYTPYAVYVHIYT
jgi:hypothetical protein